jgi:uncharacterized protein
MAPENPLTGPRQAQPTQPHDRIVELDILRGFALLGILFVNILSFGGVIGLGQEWTGEADKAIDAFIESFLRGKFISMFAMLFGVGFAMQVARLERNSGGHIVTYGRRLLVLLVIGMAHLLLDPLEVLHAYAICGALLLLFRKVPVKALLPWALILMTLPYLHTAIVSSVPSADSASQAVEESQQSENHGTREELEDDDEKSFESWNPYVGEKPARVYSSGSFTDVLNYNLQFTLNNRSSWVSYLWRTVPLPLMLVGAFIGRRRILERIPDELPLLRKTFWFGIAAGIGGAWSGMALLRLAGADGWDPWLDFAGSLVWVLAGWSMALGYGAGIVLLLQRAFWGRLLWPLQAVGKLALSNYLLQTLICTTIFYGYGVGLYGAFGPSSIALLAAAIYALQVSLSMLWVRRFRFGPAEWLWRSITYGQVQPMRVVR